MIKEFNTPILFLIFNRPDVTLRVFKEIRKLKPKILYIAADGPRCNIETDTLNCKKTRDIVVNGIDWHCDVKTLFRNQNLGCGIAVSNAITWFFENVEEGIILEDDCLPSISFFYFCEKLLLLYRNEKKISIISGTSYFVNNKKYQYYFSSLFSIWGWATWKDRWFEIEFKFNHSIEEIYEMILQKYKSEPYVNSVYNNIINTINNKNTTWDTYCSYHHIANGMLSIMPAKNLISNIGISGVHYNKKSYFNNRKLYTLNTLNLIKRDIAVDVNMEKRAISYIEKLLQKNKEKKSKFVLIKKKIIDSINYRIFSKF